MNSYNVCVSELKVNDSETKFLVEGHPTQVRFGPVLPASWTESWHLRESAIEIQSVDRADIDQWTGRHDT